MCSNTVQSLSVFVLSNNLSQFEFDWAIGQEKKFSNQANSKCVVLLKKGFATKRFSIRVSRIFFPIVPIVNIIILNNDIVVLFCG